jgi:hypothetical protein
MAFISNVGKVNIHLPELFASLPNRRLFPSPEIAGDY